MTMKYHRKAIEEAMTEVAKATSTRSTNTRPITATAVSANIQGLRARTRPSGKRHDADAMDAIHELERAIGELQASIGAAIADVAQATSPENRSRAQQRLSSLQEQMRRLQEQLAEARKRQINEAGRARMRI